MEYTGIGVNKVFGVVHRKGCIVLTRICRGFPGSEPTQETGLNDCTG
jgi:hypothetical protein